MSKLKSVINKKDFEDFNKRFLENAKDYGEVEEIDLDGNYNILKLTLNPDGHRSVAFVGGIHGDEPGGPEGIVKFLEDKIKIPDDLRVIIVPVANPSGFELKTRKNSAGVDINREFFAEEGPAECKCLWNVLKEENLELLHTLHEDPGLKSFYCYYTHHKTLAEQIRDLASKYFSIFSRDVREPLEGELYGDKVFDGLIPLPHTVRGTIEDKILAEKNCSYITTESPGKLGLRRRAKFNSDVMKMVINEI